MKKELLFAALSIAFVPGAFADDNPVASSEYSYDADYAYENGFESCIKRKEKTRVETSREKLGKGREQRSAHYKFYTKSYNAFIESTSVRLGDINKQGSGRGCENLRHIRKDGAPGITGLEFTAHARSNGVGSRGVQECQLEWTECKK